MRKILIWCIVAVFALSLTFVGIGCKEGEVKVETVVETVTETVTETVVETVVEEEETGVELVPELFQCDIDWRQFEGDTIKILFIGHPWQEAIMPLLPEFTELTGIKIDWSKLPHEESMTKVPADFTAGTFNYDLWMARFMDAPKFTLEGWTADLDEFINDPALTDKEWYNEEDFFDSAREIASWGLYKDRVPITAECNIFSYVKDVFEELDLEVPTTFDEYIDIIKTIHESDIGMAGTTMRGGPGAWYPMVAYIASHGGDYWTENDEIMINSPESVAGWETMVEISKYTPPGVTDYGWDNVSVAMSSGASATFLDSSVAYSRLENPETSAVAGKLGYAPYVEGPAGRHSLGHYWSVSVSNTSEKGAQAWLFLQWATSEPVQRKLAVDYQVLPPRASIWEDPDFLAAFDSDYINAVKVTLPDSVNMKSAPKAGMHMWELLDVLTRHIQMAILEELTPQEAADACAAQWENIISE